MFQNTYWVILSLWKTTQWNLHLFRSLKILYLYLPHLFSELPEIRCKRSALNAEGVFEFRWSRRKEGPQLFAWSTWSDSCACTAKPCEIFKVNYFLKSQGVYHCRFFFLRIGWASSRPMAREHLDDRWIVFEWCAEWNILSQGQVTQGRREFNNEKLHNFF